MRYICYGALKAVKRFCCKTVYAWALAIRTRRKPRLFSRPTEAAFPPPGCEKSP